MSAQVLQQSMNVGMSRQMLAESHQPSSIWTEIESKMNMYGVNVKTEPADDQRNDSGVTSGSDCPSASPGSDRSDTHHTSNNIYPFSPRGAPIPHFPTWTPEQQGMQNHSERRSVSPKMDADENSTEFDDDGIRVPKINSHGKVKVHKCKQCEFFAYTKLEFWEHSKVHIKGDKILKCPKCPFVTEYKHHLEYHILNHAGAKPFKCPHCDYSCVNKSMLNSHLKSHSKIYQYRCSNCHYETKYCHSLKLHLRKYGHKPAMVLNPDGSPNPLPIIDVYGTRRGPKIKKEQNSSSNESVSEQEQHVPMMGLNSFMLNQNPTIPPFPLPLIPGFPGAMPNQEMVLNFQNMVRERLMAEIAKQNSLADNTPPQPKMQQEEEEEEAEENGALDLTNKSNHTSEHSGSDNEDDSMTVAFDNVEVVQNKTSDPEVTLTPEAVRQTDVEGASTQTHNNNNNNKYEYTCKFCDMCFGDEVMYAIHKGYHGEGNPFNCKMCGEACENRVSFFWHIARAAH